MVLRGELLQGPVRDPLLVEAVGVVLTGHLVRRWSSQPSLRQVKGQLSARQIRNALEVIEHSLPSGIRVRDLAKQIGTGDSPVHAAFPANDGLQSIPLCDVATGCSPFKEIEERAQNHSSLLG